MLITLLCSETMGDWDNTIDKAMSRRKILTTIIIPALLISGLIIILVNNQREFPGELVLSQERLDFGTVPEWEGQVTKTVSARNIGKSSLHISKIQTGCSYAEIEGPKVIPPDTEGIFRVLLDPQMLPDGSTSATAILFTDSSKTPQVYLTIAATAKRFATLSAEVCDFGEILPKTLYEKQVKLCVNAPLNQQEIRLLPSETPMLTWEMAPDPSSECFIITIQLRVSKKDSEVNRTTHHYNVGKPFSALLTAAFPNERTLTLPIVARIVGPVKVINRKVSPNGAVNAKTTPSLEFTLSAKTEFKILGIQAPNYLKVVDISETVKSKINPSHYQRWFKVSWDVSKSPSLLREEIHITTSATSTPIRIPVYGYANANRLTNPSSRQVE
ncbi:MAG: DUF1573 domain-containing protein [Candidatus Poribacteria bacterium]|nr:DUF1573 domain-containing protein [Candidatus Poribacteria bacterium]